MGRSHAQIEAADPVMHLPVMVRRPRLGRGPGTASARRTLSLGTRGGIRVGFETRPVDARTDVRQFVASVRAERASLEGYELVASGETPVNGGVGMRELVRVIGPEGGSIVRLELYWIEAEEARCAWASAPGVDGETPEPTLELLIERSILAAPASNEEANWKDLRKAWSEVSQWY